MKLQTMGSSLLAVIFTFATSLLFATTQPSIRLSKEVLPTEYQLSFEPNFKDFSFIGTETIKLTVLSKTQSITLNGLEMKIESASIKPNSSATTALTQDATVDYDKKKEQITFSFKSPLTPGDYILDSKFTGILNDQLRGFYRSFYRDEKGHKQWLATTQMEATDARRMFPCFDEPDFKAIYQITAIIDPQFVAISNTPILEEKTVDGKKIIRFEPSPKMSTYLVALIVGDLKRAGSKVDAKGVPISVWTTPGKEGLGKFALDLATEILPNQANYFGIPYPGKKLDLIALPDFNAGAMENIGAITFREEYLLVDDKTGSSFQKRNIASIEAHEMAHQWFGDLVTMSWWDDIWLNEAFATWMATRTMESLHPEWRFLAQALEDYNDAKSVDQLQSTRAIHAPVYNPSEAKEMFDVITYTKGAALLRMLECYIGETTFQRGVHAYLQAHAYGNAETKDLWLALASASGGKIAVQTIMKSWVYQVGFPLLSASLQQNGKSIKIEQKRYFEDADAKPSKQLWQVPIVFETFLHSDHVDYQLLSKSKGVHVFQKPQSLIFANKDGAGFYRVQYSQQAFDLLVKRFAELTAEEKLVFLADTSALTMAGKMPVENALNLMLNIDKETDPLVLLAFVRYFTLLIPSIDTATQTAYATMVQTHLRPFKQRLSWQGKAGEPELNKDLRTAVLNLLGTYGQDKQTIEEAFHLFNQYVLNHQSVNSDIVPALVQIVAFNGSKQDYQTLVDLWKSAKNPEDEKRFLYGLAGFNTPALIAKTLKLTLSGEVRGQDITWLLSPLLTRFNTQEQALAFINQHWKELRKLIPLMELSNIPASCGTFYTRAAEQDLRAFYEHHKIPYASSDVSRSLEKVHINVLFQEQNAERIRKYIRDKDEALSLQGQHSP